MDEESQPSKTEAVVETKEAFPRRHSSQALRELIENYGDKGIVAQELIDTLGNQAVLLSCLIFALPPAIAPLPGVASLPALIILILAGRLAAGRPPKLPKRLREYQLSPWLLRALAKPGERLLVFLEHYTRPSMVWMTETRALRRAHAGFIALAGFIMALPMPIPFANGIPSWWIIFLTVGLLERDGRFIVLGYLAYIVGLGYIVGFLVGGGFLLYEGAEVLIENGSQ